MFVFCFYSVWIIANAYKIIYKFRYLVSIFTKKNWMLILVFIQFLIVTNSVKFPVIIDVPTDNCFLFRQNNKAI